jgi:hypothetical protein
MRPELTPRKSLTARGRPFVDRAVLLAPAAVARTAASRARRPEERWLLRQPRSVRASYVREVLDSRGRANAEEIWMLRQSKAVRESYIREVLDSGA